MEAGSKTCTKCGLPKPADREHFDWSERDGLSARCIECRRKNGKSHYETNKVVYFAQADTRRLDIVEFIRSLKAKPCADCGNSYPHYVMDFDHRGDKTINLSHPRVKRWGKDRILAEVAKCDVVCANCHRIRSFERGQHLASEVSNG